MQSKKASLSKLSSIMLVASCTKVFPDILNLLFLVIHIFVRANDIIFASDDASGNWEVRHSNTMLSEAVTHIYV